MMSANESAIVRGKEHEENRDLEWNVLPEFPLDVFPGPYHKALQEIAEACAVPTEVPASSFLAIAGACIGRTRGIQIKEDWVEHANLFLALVGNSGTGKSPATKVIFRPVLEKEESWSLDLEKRLYSHEERKREFEVAIKEDPETLLELSEPPVEKQLIVDDVTTESIAEVLDGNPRGIMWYRDELAGLLLDLDKYSGKNGGTKSRLMSAYDSGIWKVSRKTKGKNLIIPHATVSIFGTIQPLTLRSVFSSRDAATGFLPRFLFVHLQQRKPSLWTDKTVSEETRRTISQLIFLLLEYSFENGAPQIIRVDAAAKDIFKEWHDRQVLEPSTDIDSEQYCAVFAKLRGQCLRIALILHCMDAAAKNASELAPVGEATMSRAIRLADYLKEHQKFTWSYLANDATKPLTPLQQRVAQAILDLQPGIFGGMLATEKITERLNEGLEGTLHLSSNQVGKAASSLGLANGHLPDKKARGIRVDDLVLATLKKKLKRTVPYVPNVRHRDLLIAKEQENTGVQGPMEAQPQESSRQSVNPADQVVRHPIKRKPVLAAPLAREGGVLNPQK